MDLNGTQQQLEPNQPADAPAKNRRGQLIKDYLTLFLASGTIILLDAWTKDLVDTKLPLGKGWLPDQLSGLLPYVRIIHLQNKGTAFGLFRDENQINLVITIIAIIASIFILYIFPRIEKKERALRVALILQLAGAVGNLISRIRYGYVLDFISVGTFPVFNVADSSITIGLVVLLLGMLWQEYQERKRPKPAENGDPV
jgi:signal peptidase II